MLEKIRIKDISAALGVANKEIVQLLAAHFPETKTLNSVLGETELDVIFEHYTIARGVENFEEFYKLAELKPKAPAKKPVEVKKPSTAPKKPPTKEERAASETLAKAAAQHKSSAPTAPPKVNKPKKEGAAPQARTKAEAKTIDTRSGSVNLDKYNERYETIAPATHAAQNNRRADTQTNKQKLNQRSKQYRKQGMRSSRRETEAQRLQRIAADRAKKPQLIIKVGEEIQIGELAMRLKRTAAEVIKELFKMGQMSTINDMIDYDTAELISAELGVKVQREVVVTIEERIIDDRQDSDDELVARDPVVVVMGHVDHGKTSLLDAIRSTAVTETEAGGITQHIGAYRVEVQDRHVTFLDTPGHAAFTAMRARGAKATDIAILVVAANDGIMPQTIEAIAHAKAAEVNIVVAINKIDLHDTNVDKIMQQLTEHELVPEEWGGDTICVPVSAKTGQGMDNLLESLLLVADMQQLRANPNRAAKGVVIEARLDKTRGPIATVLVQNGTLKSGDVIVAGQAVGRVRVMTDHNGVALEQAGPSVPVEIMGLAEAPAAGESFDAVSDERLARELVEQRKYHAREEIFNLNQQVTLETLFDTLKEGELKDLNIIVKADVQGTAEAVKQNLLKLSNEEVRVRVIHAGVGAVSESDVMLASASGALVVAFNVTADPIAANNADREGVQLRRYSIIYDMMNDVEQAVKGMLAPKFREVAMGRVEVRQVMKFSSATVCGSYVQEGKVQRGALCRVTRDGVVVAEDTIASLRRFKDDVKEVARNYECGITLEKFADAKDGDILEVYVMEEYRD
ncbi:MAG: translation initiation factor IF-2 [Oscillospiraceae bacterium]|nr:translation initiation factor IF-2 [Oscillospiraceae bacterium]